MAHSDTGTPVTLVVRPAQPTPATPPGHHPLPLTGFDLVGALTLGALLLAAGSALAAVRRPAALLARRPR